VNWKKGKKVTKNFRSLRAVLLQSGQGSLILREQYKGLEKELEKSGRDREGPGHAPKSSVGPAIVRAEDIPFFQHQVQGNHSSMNPSVVEHLRINKPA